MVEGEIIAEANVNNNANTDWTQNTSFSIKLIK